MHNRLPDYFRLGDYNISPEDVVRSTLHCEPNIIQSKVIIMPSWGPEIFTDVADDITEIESGTPGVWHVRYCGQSISLIRSGMGAWMAGETVLALGCTPCEFIIFTGSMAGLSNDSQIGDLCVVDGSLCGDGYSRYLSLKIIPDDCFLERVAPDRAFTKHLRKQAKLLCKNQPIALHHGTIMSIDSVLAEFFRLNYFVRELQCVGVEMETAAVFKSARLVEIKSAALLIVSDTPLKTKSLYSGRTQEDIEHLHIIRRSVLAKAILSSVISLS